MTGTGTSADPYIPENWDELVSCAKTSGAYISLPEGGEWDMNEQYPTGAPTLEMQGCHIDGNGFVIKNLYSEDTMIQIGEGTSVEIKNLVFQNIYSHGDYLIRGRNSYAGWLKMENVEMSGTIVNSAIFRDNQWGYTQNSFERCSFNFRLKGADGDMNYLNFRFCNINLVGSVKDKMLIKMENSSQLIGALDCDSSQSFTIDGESSLSKIDMGIKGFSSVACSLGVNVVINTNKVDSGITVSDNLIKATTEQMSDAEWLNEHGFPCGKES